MPTLEEFAKLLDEKLEPINARLTLVESKVGALDDSINKTEDEGKPSLRMQVIQLRWDLKQVQGTLAKVWTVLGVPPVTVLIGYAMFSLFGNHGQK